MLSSSCSNFRRRICGFCPVHINVTTSEISLLNILMLIFPFGVLTLLVGVLYFRTCDQTHMLLTHMLDMLESVQMIVS